MKAQLAVVLILKHVRRQGIVFKYHLTDSEKPGIKPWAPWIYKAYATGDVILMFLAVFFGYKPVLAGWVYVFLAVLCPGAPKGSTCSSSGFEGSQKMVHCLKSQPTDWEKPEIEPATPGLQDIGLSPTSRWRRNSHFETYQVK